MSQHIAVTMVEQLMEHLRHTSPTLSPTLPPDVAADSVQLLETHISWIILTGKIAYKLKKPVNLGFLDFSTLDNRKHYCEEELRLNARLAADLYLGVVPITGTPEQPVINGDGPVIEYAIRMRQFPQSAQLDNRLQQGLLSTANIEALGDVMANFHQQLPPATPFCEYGDLSHIHLAVNDNLAVLNQYIYVTEKREDNGELSQDQQTLRSLGNWVSAQNQALESTFIQRKKDGFIRECHGDLHLRNLIWLDDHPVAFDCLEFDESLRWTDVMCEIAFLVMDLMSRDQHALAYAFLNQYLNTPETTPDSPYYPITSAIARW